MLLAVLAIGFSSCVNEEYDPENINTEITIAGEGLSLPLGSTKQMTLKNLLSSMDDDMLQVLEGGSYALRINDTLNLGNQLPDLKDMLDIPDVTMEQTMSYSLSGINDESMSIDSQTFDYEFALAEEGLVPEVELPEIFIEHVDPTGVWEYGKAAREMEIEVEDVHVKTNAIFQLPSSDITTDLVLGDVPETVVEPAEVNVRVTSECPEGISNISDVMMTEGSMLNVKLSLENRFISAGEVLPALTLDFSELLVVDGGKGSIEMADDFTLSADNGYEASKSFRIEEILVKEDDWSVSGRLDMLKRMSVSGAASLRSAVADAGLASATGGMGFRIDIEFQNLLIESVMMDVEEVEVVENMDIPVTVNDMHLPDGISDIEKVMFKENSCLDIIIDLYNLSDIEGLQTKLKTLEMTFPDGMTVREAVDGKVVLEDVDLSGGMDEKIHIDEIALTDPVDGTISYTAHVMVEAHMTAGGRICSANVPYTEEEDGAFIVDAESHFEMEDYVAVVESLDQELAMEPEEVVYNLPNSISNIGTFTVIPEGQPVMEVDLVLPETDMPVTAGKDGIKMHFPEFFRFKDVAAEYNFDPSTNTIHLSGELPDKIYMPVEKLVVTPDKDPETDGYVEKGEIHVTGSVSVPDGETLGSVLEEFAGSMAHIDAIVPEIIAEEMIFDHFEITMDESVEFQVIEAGTLPADVKKVYLVNLEDVDVEIDVAVDNFPDLDVTPDVELVMTMPEIFVLDDNDSRVDGNVVTIRSSIVDDKIEIAPVRVNAIDLSGFDPATGDDLVGNITISGAIVAENPDLDLDSVDGDILISLNAGLHDIQVGKVMADVNYDMDGLNESFKLSGLPEFMKGDDFVLDLLNPHLVIKAKTNIGIPVAGNLSIIPVIDGVEVVDNAIDASIELPYTETAAETDSVMFWFGGDPDRCPQDYTFVNADINKLISRIPDELKLSLDAGTVSDEQSVVEPSADYVLDIVYDFMIPLEFGDKLNIAIKDTLAGLPDIVKELLAKNSVQLGGSVTSSLPLCLELEVVLLDADGKAIEMEKPVVQSISSCNSDGTPAVSPLELLLDVKNGDSAYKVDALELSFKVTAPGFPDMPVAEDDFVQADLKVNLPEGITIDLGNDSDEN